MPQNDLRYISKWGLPGPNSEFLQDHCTNRLVTYIPLERALNVVLGQAN